MKSLIVYSSKTGNTKMVAEAIAEVLPQCDIMPMALAPAYDDYDFVAIGYWVDRGGPDADAKQFMQSIKGKWVGLFGTLGAYPDSDHGRECLEKARQAVEGNEVICSFLCMGKVDPKLIEMMQAMPGNRHPMTPERQARLEEAAKHPNQEDLMQAQAMFREAIDSIFGVDLPS